jgi:hypothetical protein
MQHLPFYRGIVKHALQITDIICQTTPTSKDDILIQILWNNRFIIIINQSLYFPKWHKARIMTIRDIVNEHGDVYLYKQFKWSII